MKIVKRISFGPGEKQETYKILREIKEQGRRIQKLNERFGLDVSDSMLIIEKFDKLATKEN